MIGFESQISGMMFSSAAITWPTAVWRRIRYCAQNAVPGVDVNVVPEPVPSAEASPRHVTEADDERFVSTATFVSVVPFVGSVVERAHLNSAATAVSTAVASICTTRRRTATSVVEPEACFSEGRSGAPGGDVSAQARPS